MDLGMITCNYRMRIYNYKRPDNFDWETMSEKWRAEFKKDEFLKLAAEIRGLGYENIEIWEPTFSFKVYSVEDAKDVYAELKKMGFSRTAYCIGGWSSEEAPLVDKAYAFAQALGAETVAGCIRGANQKLILDTLEEAGKKYNIRYGIENHPKPNLESPEEILEAVKPYKYIGTNVDTGVYLLLGYDLLKSMDVLKDRIFHIHLKDRKKNAAGGSTVPVGEGDVLMADAIKKLKDWQYRGMYSVEYGNDTDPAPGLKKSLEYLKGLG
jgi:sugar phosphate isomerase/epimerase